MNIQRKWNTRMILKTILHPTVHIKIRLCHSELKRATVWKFLGHSVQVVHFYKQ